MEELANRGYIAIRMGAAVREALTTSNPKIFDYATRGRTDFLDVYLSAKCAFFVSSGTGLDELTRVFRRPLLFVNFVPLEYAHTWFPDGLFIPKKLWLTDERRFLRFREIIESGVGRVLKGEEYESHGIEVIENTPAEILAAVVEMDERLKGTWETTVEDEELQRRFWSLFEGSDLHGDIVSHIGAGYLRENRELLD
jgi:putative glycosyltransferase (TIGR04372 family)